MLHKTSIPRQGRGFSSTTRHLPFRMPSCEEGIKSLLYPVRIPSYGGGGEGDTAQGSSYWSAARSPLMIGCHLVPFFSARVCCSPGRRHLLRMRIPGES